MRIKRHYFDVALAGGIMSGAVGKVAVLKSQSHNGKVLVVKMPISKAPFLAPLAGALLTGGGRAATAKLLPKVANRLRAIPRAMKVGGQVQGSSRLGNTMNMLRGKEWQNWATTPKTFGGYQRALQNPEFQALLPQGGLDATSEFAAAAQTARLGANPTRAQLVQPRRIAANKFLENQYGQGKIPNIHSSLINTDVGQATLSPGGISTEAFTPSEMGHLGAGSVGVQSMAHGGAARQAAQLEESRKLADAAKSGSQSTTVGASHMGKPSTASPTG